MKISIQGLGGRLQRARKGTGLSQEAVAKKIGVSWMTVHRWERSQRSISEENLDLVCNLYDKPLRWFLTLEDGDLDQSPKDVLGRAGGGESAAADRICRKIADAPDGDRMILVGTVDHLNDNLRAVI